MKRAERRKLARYIARDLFTSGNGRADRLVLVKEQTLGDLHQKMGGWSEECMVDRIDLIMGWFEKQQEAGDARRELRRKRKLAPAERR